MALVSEREEIRALGRYVLFGEIASGGMATVHFGRLNGPAGFSRTVAIKRLHPQFAKDPESVTMFLDEARLAGRIRHPNVVPTLDIVATEGEVLLVMEYVQGESLSRLFRTMRASGRRMPPEITVAILSGALHGLHAAHEAKDAEGRSLDIVHRDVSPQNILVGTDGVARVLDFGVAKAVGRLQVTREGQIKGKLCYMAPEQLYGSPVTRQTDIYAAAIVLWELLTDTRLFEGDSDAQILTKVLTGNVCPPSEIAHGLSVAFDRVVERGLARDPSKRFSTARDMAVALERCRRMASATEVGEWVERIAGEELHKRAAQVAEIESWSNGSSVPDEVAEIIGRVSAVRVASGATTPSDAPGSAPRIDINIEDVSPSEPVSEVSAPAAREPRRARLFPAVLAALALVLVGAAGFAAVQRWLTSGPSAATVRAPPATEAPPAQPAGARQAASSPPPVLPVAEVVSSAATVSAAAAHAATPPPPPAPRLSSSRAAPSPTPSPSVLPASRSCVPPYTIDALGHRKYKLECMTK